MWIATYHRFASRAAFLAACDAAGWGRDPLDARQPAPPAGVVLDEIGALIARPDIGEGGAPIPGDVLDARWHVNAAWHGTEIPAGFQAAQITPATPARVIALPAPAAPPPPAVPAVVPAWKAKAWLLQQGKLDAATAAAEAAGGVPLLAFQHAAEWHRDSALMAALAAALSMNAAAIDAAFIAADAIRG